LGGASDVGWVVGAPSGGSALRGGHQSRRSELAEVIRDQALGFADELAQLADTSVAASELALQSPSQRVGDELQELDLRYVALKVGHDLDNRPTGIDRSSRFDGIPRRPHRAD